ncbi:MAG: hypothetical protein NT094_01680, partial [Candidatus Staskawiczbacteria bacterium]|nr:hypothetical protein [Candidatus Staskawiczbacteria bacterium]
MRKFIIVLIVFFMPVFYFADLPTIALAQAGDLGTQCGAISESSTGCPNMSSADCQVLLKSCADYYDQQSAQLAKDITKTSQQKDTL